MAKLTDIDPFPNLGNTSKSSSGLDGFTLGMQITKQAMEFKRQREAGRHAQELQRQADAALEQQLQNPPPIHGSASWMGVDAFIQYDQQARKIAENTGDRGAIFLGRFIGTGQQESPLAIYDSADVVSTPPGHILTIAPTRAGKGAAQIIPNLLNYPGSVVVIDPKGENYQATHQQRRQFSRVIRLDPFHANGGTGGTDHYNPLEFVRNDDDARLLAEMILPKGSDKDEFWWSEAVNLLIGLILFHLERPPEKRTLGAIRDFMAHDCDKNLLKMKEHAQHPTARSAAEGFLNKTPAEQSGVRSQMNTKMAIFENSELRALFDVAASDFSFADLKPEGEAKPLSIYIILPLQHQQTYPVFQRILIGQALNTMLAIPRRPKDSILFILDEFANLGRMDRLVEGYSYLAGVGVRLWTFIQDLNQLESLYPIRWKSVLSQSSTKSFFAPDDLDTLKYISENLGNMTQAVASVSGNQGGLNMSHGNPDGGISKGVQLYGRPLLTPDEVKMMIGRNQGRQIVFLEHPKPVLATLDNRYAVPEVWERQQKRAKRWPDYPPQEEESPSPAPQSSETALNTPSDASSDFPLGITLLIVLGVCGGFLALLL